MMLKLEDVARACALFWSKEWVPSDSLESHTEYADKTWEFYIGEAEMWLKINEELRFIVRKQ